MKYLVSIGAVAGLLAAVAPVQAEGRRRAARPRAEARPACGDDLSFQVLLDRHGFSSGEIDGKSGANTRRAAAAFQEANKLPVTRTLDCETWSALGGNDQRAWTTEYTITDADAAGPFVENIPASLPDQASLPSLGYRSLSEKIAERFHASPALLTRLNPNANFAAGKTIVVPDVAPFDVGTKPAHDTSVRDVSVEVSREGSLRVTSEGRIVFVAPVTSGSNHDPLPLGSWKVQAVAWMPAFHYNPDLFWDAKSTDTKATIKPGPNNPVGVVWIDISVEHYGLHGTPEPSRIGYAQSHGCVRLTNWDAARLATLVVPNTPVIFE